MAAPVALYSLLGNSSGAEVFIAPTGNDTTGDGSIGNPWKSLDKARDNVATNGIISLRYAGGTAHRPLSGERVTWQKNGSSRSDPITIRTYPGDNPNYTTGANLAKFQGEILAGGSGSTKFSFLKITDLEIVNTPGTARGGAGVSAVKAENFGSIEVTRVRGHNTIETIFHMVGSVDAIRTDDWHVHHCMGWNAGTTDGTGPPSTNNHDHLFYLENCHNGQAYNNIGFDCHYGSLCQFFPRAGTNIVAYNTFFDTSAGSPAWDGGTSVGNPTSFFYGTTAPGLVDNVVSSNIYMRSRQDATLRLAIETSGAQGSGNLLLKNLPFQISDTALWGNSALWLNNATRAADNLAMQDPQFVSVVAGGGLANDFHLQSTSPARDAGTAAYLPSDDFYGTSRGGVKDLGAVAFAAAGGGGSPVNRRVSAHTGTVYAPSVQTSGVRR